MLWEIKYKNKIDIGSLTSIVKLISLQLSQGFLVQSKEIPIPRNWILINYHRLFSVFHSAGPCGRENGLALQVRVQERRRFKITAF